MNSLRIGVDIRGLLTGKLSGVEQCTLQILRHVLEIDTTNTYVLFFVDYKNQKQLFVQLATDYPFLKNKNVEVRTLKWLGLPLFLHAFFKPLNWPKADLVCGGLDVMFMPSPRLLPISSKCAKVTLVHDLIFMIHPEFFTASSRLWQWQMSYGYEIRTSDLTIAVSDNTKRDILRFTDAEPGRIKVIYEGVGEEYFADLSGMMPELRARFEIPEQYIYFVGSMEPRKNLSTLIRALDDLKKLGNDTIKLVISGQKSWLFEDVRKLINELGLQSRIIFTGPVTEQEKISLMGGATVFVFPSVYEGFGLMTLESFATSTPVIVSDNSCMPEVAGGAAVVVSTFDDVEMANAIWELLTNTEKRERLVEQGRKRAKLLTWNRTAERVLQTITTAVELHGQ